MTIAVATEPHYTAAVIPPRQPVEPTAPATHLLLVALPKGATARSERRSPSQSAPGSFLYLPPGKDRPQENPFDAEAFLLGFGQPFLEERQALRALEQVARPQDGLHDPIIADLITLAIGQQRALEKIHLDARAEALVIAALIRIADRLNGEEGPVPYCNPALSAALAYVSDNLSKRIDLEGIADHAKLSQFQLSRLFRKALGTSVHQHILSERCRLAADLLVATDESLSEIAYRSGFSSQSHMTTVIKDRLGTTPGRLRCDRQLRV